MCKLLLKPYQPALLGPARRIVIIVLLKADAAAKTDGAAALTFLAAVIANLLFLRLKPFPL